MSVTLCWATELHENRFGEIRALLTGVNQLLSDFGGIGCQIPPHGNAVEHMSLSRISALGRPYSPYVRKWSVADDCARATVWDFENEDVPAKVYAVAYRGGGGGGIQPDGENC